jgi:hypothetical protein
MQLFFFLVVVALICFLLFSLLTPSLGEDVDELEVWESKDQRLESCLLGVVNSSPQTRQHCHNQILSMGRGVIPRLVNTLSQELCFSQPNAEWIERIEDLIRDFGLQAVPFILDWLKEEGDNPLVIESAHRLILQHGDPVLRIIIERLDPTLLFYLMPVMRKWSDVTIKLAVRRFLQEPKRKLWHQLFLELGKSAESVLLVGYKQWQGEIKRQSLHILAMMASTESLPLFLDALSSSDVQMRVDAVRGLSLLKDNSTFVRISPLLSDPSEEVRKLVIPLLSVLDGNLAIVLLQEYQEQLIDQPQRLSEALLISKILADLEQPVSALWVQRGWYSSDAKIQALALTLADRLPCEERFGCFKLIIEHSNEKIASDALRLLGQKPSSWAISLLLDKYSSLDDLHPHRAIIEEVISQSTDWSMPFVGKHFKKYQDQKDKDIFGLLLRVMLRCGDSRVLEMLLEVIQSDENAEEVLGISSVDLFAYFRRIAKDDDISFLLKRFLQKHPESILSGVIESFLEEYQQNKANNSALELDTKAPKIYSGE